MSFLTTEQIFLKLSDVAIILFICEIEPYLVLLTLCVWQMLKIRGVPDSFFQSNPVPDFAMLNPPDPVPDPDSVGRKPFIMLVQMVGPIDIDVFYYL